MSVTHHPADVEQLESAIAAADALIWDANHLADFYWAKGGKYDKITDCLVDTPKMEAAAEQVGVAYRGLAEAVGAYRRAAKAALDLATEKAARA